MGRPVDTVMGVCCQISSRPAAGMRFADMVESSTHVGMLNTTRLLPP